MALPSALPIPEDTPEPHLRALPQPSLQQRPTPQLTISELLSSPTPDRLALENFCGSLARYANDYVCGIQREVPFVKWLSPEVISHLRERAENRGQYRRVSRSDNSGPATAADEHRAEIIELFSSDHREPEFGAPLPPLTAEMYRVVRALVPRDPAHTSQVYLQAPDRRRREVVVTLTRAKRTTVVTMCLRWRKDHWVVTELWTL